MPSREGMNEQKLTSPLKWYGAKHRLCPWLRFWMPRSVRYCEVFGGGGSLLFAKTAGAAETYNDVDPWVATFFRILKSDGERLADALREMSFDRTEEIFNSDYPESADELEKAVYLFVNSRASFSGEVHGRRCFALRDAGRVPKESKYKVYRNTIEKLAAYSARPRC